MLFDRGWKPFQMALFIKIFGRY